MNPAVFKISTRTRARQNGRKRKLLSMRGFINELGCSLQEFAELQKSNLLPPSFWVIKGNKKVRRWLKSEVQAWLSGALTLSDLREKLYDDDESDEEFKGCNK